MIIYVHHQPTLIEQENSILNNYGFIHLLTRRLLRPGIVLENRIPRSILRVLAARRGYVTMEDAGVTNAKMGTDDLSS